MKIADIRLVESLNQPAPWRWVTKSFNEYEAHASIDHEDDLVIGFIEENEEQWEISFVRENHGGHHTSIATGQGSEFKVFATVVDVITNWWNELSSDGYRPEAIYFTANKSAGDSPRRAKLYSRFAQKFAAQIGYHMHVNTSGIYKDVFILSNPDA